MVSSSPPAREYFDRLSEQLLAAGKIREPSPGQTVEEANPDWCWFRAACKRRLDVGAETYGPTNYKDGPGAALNLAEEALEELMDVALYALLEIDKNHPEETHRVLLAEAVYHAFLSAQFLLAYRSKQRLYG